MNRLTTLSAIAVSLCLSGAAALAGSSPQDQAFQKKIFGRAIAAQKIHACFKRVYDAGHLAQHPQQNVRTMLLLVSGDPGDGEAPNYGLGMSVTFRKSGQHFETSGSCGAIRDTADVGGTSGTAHCGVDCDGGSIDVAIRDASSVLVSIPEGARIWRAGDTDDTPKSESKRFGADDKVFRLDKTALTDCLGLGIDAADKAALRRGQ